MAVSLEISPHKRLFPGHLDDTYLSLVAPGLVHLVLGRGCKILCLKGQQMDKAMGNKRDKLQLNGQETVFCVDLSQGR